MMSSSERDILFRYWTKWTDLDENSSENQLSEILSFLEMAPCLYTGVQHEGV